MQLKSVSRYLWRGVAWRGMAPALISQRVAGTAASDAVSIIEGPVSLSFSRHSSFPKSNFDETYFEKNALD